ncbi:hypothetical protein [Xanthobacter flavus]|uniref:hypothetical protein n=1 Tax=Xanthobacter flavus TaxID=281 RepID=UPI00372BA279
MKDKPPPPMDLANMRANGVRHIMAYCVACNHTSDVLVDHLPDETPVPSIARRMRCSACGSRKVTARPAWHLKHGKPPSG